MSTSTASETQATLRSAYQETARLLGRKWHLIILAHLLEEGEAGFGDLVRAEDISSKVLSETLTDLDEKGFVDRDVVSDQPKRVRYSLTERGRSFGSVVRQIRRWYLEQEGITVCEHCDAALVDDRTCPYCDEAYCAVHRLPESHDCAGLGFATGWTGPTGRSPTAP
jgi:DNA-binding HxlR family transcriptional regulator